MNADTEKEQKELTSIEDESRNEKEEKDVEENKDIDSAEPELLKNLPPEAKKVLEIGMSMHRFGPMPNPIAEKINEKHIDKILDISEKDDERAYKNTGETRKYTLIYYEHKIQLDS
jgi:hypothetical protein